MSTQRLPLIAVTSSMLMVAMAGCVIDGDLTGATGTVFFCVQDDPTVNFSGVFVNFGNIQINQNTSGNNPINDNNDTISVNDNDTGTIDDDASTTVDDDDTDNTTTDTVETTDTVTDSVTETTAVTDTVSAGGDVTVITPEDIDCGQAAVSGEVDDFFRGQVGGGTDRDVEDCAPENPGCVADTQRGRADSPCDRDQGFGNDDRADCQTIEVEAEEVDLMQFKENRAAFLGKGDLPSGTIDDVCVTVDEVRATTSDGQEVTVQIEDDQVCVEGPIQVSEDQNTLVVLRIDVANSFRSTAETGDGTGNTTLIFAPVIHVHASAPVTQTIVIEETVTTTADGTTEMTDTMTSMPPEDTMMTNETAPDNTTAPPPSEPAPTNETSPSPTNETAPPDNGTEP